MQHTRHMNTITLKPELFQSVEFKETFKEKLNAARKFDYNSSAQFTGNELKHYHYYRAVRGVLADIAFAGYLLQNNIPFKYNSKTGTRKSSTGIDFRLENNIKINVKASQSFWKLNSLIRNGIDYVVVCSAILDNLEGVYVKNGATLLASYRALFKNPITVNLVGWQSSDRIIDAGPLSYTYTLENIDTLIPDIKLMHNGNTIM